MAHESVYEDRKEEKLFVKCLVKANSYAVCFTFFVGEKAKIEE